MKNKQTFIVIPTIRNLTFLKEWRTQFRKYNAIIIEDHENQEVETPNSYFRKVYHFTWRDIDRDFGAVSWIFSRKNAGIRSYGFYKAYTLGADVIITLDDDCYPTEEDFVKQHLDNLSFKSATSWFPTYPDPKYIHTRGFPYRVRSQVSVMISHGLWSGAIDLDAQTEIKLSKLLNEKPYPPLRQVIPFGYFFPMCSMNLAFRREVMPLMYFPLMGFDPNGNRWGYDRYDDIWAGLFVKHICDHLGWGVMNGSPIIEHRKASSIPGNVIKEKPGLKINEFLWLRVKQVKLTKKTPVACYEEMIEKINFPKTDYFSHLRQAMSIWIKKYEAPSTLRSGYLLPMLRRERNPSEAENSSHSFASLRSRFSAKGDKSKR